MNQFNEFLLLLDSNLSGSWWFPILLVGTGIFFTIYLDARTQALYSRQ